MPDVFTTSSTLDDLCAIAIAEATSVISSNIDLRATVTKRQLNQGQVSARFPRRGALTAAELAEGDTASAQAMSTSGVVLTPTVKIVGAIVTDLADFATGGQTMLDFGKDAGQAILKLANQQIFALFDGFSTSYGTTNVDVTEAGIRYAVKKLTQANAPGPFYFAATPEVIEDLLGLYSLNTNQTSDVVRNAVYAGEMPLIYGVKPLVVSCGVDESTDVKCGIYSSAALGMALAYDVKIDVAKKPLAGGWEVAATTAFAVGELVDAYGVEMLCDGAD